MFKQTFRTNPKFACANNTDDLQSTSPYLAMAKLQTLSNITLPKLFLNLSVYASLYSAYTILLEKCDETIGF